MDLNFELVGATNKNTNTNTNTKSGVRTCFIRRNQSGLFLFLGLWAGLVLVRRRFITVRILRVQACCDLRLGIIPYRRFKVRESLVHTLGEKLHLFEM